MSGQPWATGPREILQHGLSMLHTDSDTNRRLALLSIDNAIELTAKTFLGLPKRLSGIHVPRREFADASESFPKLIDALETYAADRVDGINLGEIEWFHRLRNQLYHQGNGLTVEKEKVEIYAELAKLLFENLFGEALPVAPEDEHKRLGEFLACWVKFEKALGRIADRHVDSVPTLKGRPLTNHTAIRHLVAAGVFSPRDAQVIEEMRQLRNSIVHGSVDYNKAITKNTIRQLKEITAKYAAGEDDGASE